MSVMNVRIRRILIDDDDADNKPVWPIWAEGALFRGARRIHIDRVCENRVCFHITSPSSRVGTFLLRLLIEAGIILVPPCRGG